MEKSEDNKAVPGFHSMELDHRIQKAIAKLGWINATLIQEKAIPILLEGKDVLIRAATGTGKTGSFVIPTIEKILKAKQEQSEQVIGAIILAPSKELCGQIKRVVDDLSIKCARIVKCVELASSEIHVQKYNLSEKPDIIVSTPAKVLQHFKSGTLTLDSNFHTLIIDEADLMFSYGFANDLKETLSYLPAIYQGVLASATLSEEVLELKGLVLNNPVILKLTTNDLGNASNLSHYHILAEEDDKAAILYALFKLHLLRGKSLIFVNTVDRCYKLKLFMEQFNIRTCVLNPELPSTIRCRVIQQFNMGTYDIIIASDDKSLMDVNPTKKEDTKPARASKLDAEASVSRGIDFRDIANVVNFDFPLDTNSYVHRAGRTARGFNKGSVLSFVNIAEKTLLDTTEEQLKTIYGSDESISKKYQFKLEEVEPFRYRARDAYKAVTGIAVRESRLKELKTEIFNNNKLKSFFESNPHDLRVLRHDKPLHTVKLQPHLSDVPDYIVPDPLKNIAGIKTRKRAASQTSSKGKRVFEKKKANPLLCAEIDYAKKPKIKRKPLKKNAK